MAVVDNIGDKEVFLQGKCYFQIVAFNGKLPKYQLVDNVNNNTSKVLVVLEVQQIKQYF